MTSGICKQCGAFCHCIECEGACATCGNDDLMNGFEVDFNSEPVTQCEIDPKDFE